MTKLIVGCGYLGCRVARHWLAGGVPLAMPVLVAVVRHAEQAEALASQGIQAMVADVTRPETLCQLPAAETVLFAVGYDPQGGRSRREVHVDGLRAVLDALSPKTGRVIFISSTSVFGESGGLLDEQSPCRPTREAGRVLLAAEEVLKNHVLGDRSVILRLAGIYGPGRLPRLADLASGGPLGVPANSMVNLIHVDDAARVIIAAERHSRPSRTYIVSDGHPVQRREYLSYLAQVSGLAPPQFREPIEGDESARSRGGYKRVSNARMLAELGVQLVYPTYRDGLTSAAK